MMQEIRALKALCLDLPREESMRLRAVISSLEEAMPAVRVSLLDVAKIGFDTRGLDPNTWGHLAEQAGYLFKESDDFKLALAIILGEAEIPRVFEWLIVDGKINQQQYIAWCFLPIEKTWEDVLGRLLLHAPSFREETIYILRSGRAYLFSLPGREKVEEGVLIDIYESEGREGWPHATFQMTNKLISVPVRNIFLSVDDILDVPIDSRRQ